MSVTVEVNGEWGLLILILFSGHVGFGKKVWWLVFFSIRGMTTTGALGMSPSECGWVHSPCSDPHGTAGWTNNTLISSCAALGGGKDTQEVSQKYFAKEKPEIQWEVGFLAKNTQSALEKFDFGISLNDFGWCLVKNRIASFPGRTREA